MNTYEKALATALLASSPLLSGCAGESQLRDAPTGAEAYRIAPPRSASAAGESYKLAPGDILKVQVFQEPDLSNASLAVDNVGNIQIPLIGEVAAAGRAPSDVSDEISRRLRAKYLVNPQVVVSIVQSASRFVSVDGQVAKPGVYEIDSDYTLLSAIARAEGLVRTAKQNEIVILRTIDGKPMAARFDVAQIRAGKAPDPRILPGDAVVVGRSRLSTIWEDFLQIAPLNAFVLAVTR